MPEELKVKVEDPSPQKEEVKEETVTEEEPKQTNKELYTVPRKEAPKEEDEASTTVKKEDDTPASNGSDALAPAPVQPPSDPRLSVPRKVPATPLDASDPRSPTSASSFHATSTSETATPTRPGYPGTSVGLPEGISVPMGVDSKLLQGRLLDTLKQLPNDLICDALNEYDDALQNKGGSIRNQGAYLYGVIKRYVNVQERAASGNADHVMGKQLTPVVTVSIFALSGTLSWHKSHLLTNTCCLFINLGTLG